jgi:hypothetical protein
VSAALGVFGRDTRKSTDWTKQRKIIEMEDAYTRSTEEVLKHFQALEATGLSERQVELSRAKHGRNGADTPGSTPNTR